MLVKDFDSYNAPSEVTPVVPTPTFHGTTALVPTVNVVPQFKSYAIDPKVDSLRSMGKGFANIVQYTRFMKDNPEGISDVSQRLNTGRLRGYYEGTDAGSGKLGYAGLVLDWKVLSEVK